MSKKTLIHISTEWTEDGDVTRVACDENMELVSGVAEFHQMLDQEKGGFTDLFTKIYGNERACRACVSIEA